MRLSVIPFKRSTTVSSFSKIGSLAKLFIPEAKNKYATRGNTKRIVRTKYFFNEILLKVPTNEAFVHYIVNVITLNEKYKSSVCY